jgi:hypothetical protein
MKYFSINLMPRTDPEFCFLDDAPPALGLRASRLLLGKPLLLDYPEDVRLFMSEDEPGIEVPDFVGNTLNYFICSQRMKEVLEAQQRDQVEYLPVSIYNHRRRLAAANYFVVNPLGGVDCLDLDASEIEYHEGKVVGVDKYVLDASKLQAGPSLFRVREEPTMYVLNERIVRALIAMAPRPSNVLLIKLEVTNEGDQ